MNRLGTLLAIGLALALSACASRERQMMADDRTCMNYGFTPGTDRYSQCRYALDQRRAESRERAGDALIGLGGAMMLQSQPVYRPPAQTLCHRQPGGSFTCTTH